MTVWTGRSRGGLWIVRLMAASVHLLGYRGIHLVSWVGGLVALLFDHRARSALIAYHQRRRPDLDRTEALGLVWRHCASFGRILCDRALVYGCRAPRIHHRGGRALWRWVRSGRGCVLLSAHIGNWEYGGRLLTRLAPDVEVQLVKVANEDPRERAMVDAAMGDRAPGRIDPDDPVAAALAIQAALDRGAVVGFLGDRVRRGQPALQVRLFGAPYAVPAGPFQAAQSSGRPLLIAFVLRRGAGRYLLDVQPPLWVAAGRGRRRRRAHLQVAAERYAAAMESILQRYPLQWHNFYDAWRLNDPRDAG